MGILDWHCIRRSNIELVVQERRFHHTVHRGPERSKAFYQDVFGLRLVFEDENSAVFRFANTGINLLRSEAASELVSPGAVADRNAGARLVSQSGWNNVDAVCAELTARGVELLNGR